MSQKFACADLDLPHHCRTRQKLEQSLQSHLFPLNLVGDHPLSRFFVELALLLSSSAAVATPPMNYRQKAAALPNRHNSLPLSPLSCNVLFVSLVHNPPLSPPSHHLMLRGTCSCRHRNLLTHPSPWMYGRHHRAGVIRTTRMPNRNGLGQ